MNKQTFSAEDRKRFEELQKEITVLSKYPLGDVFDAFMAAWKESEAIKNKYGGNAPTKQETT